MTVIAIDAGTSGVRALAFDEDLQVVATSHRELPQHFPAPGLVEHDPSEIWDLCEETLSELSSLIDPGSVAAVGVTNQRETAVAWDRATGRPLHSAIVWQDRRTAQRCEELTAAGHLELVRQRTGLVLDPYFSATKWAWMLEKGGVEPGPGLALGTVDDWVCWNLTGGAAGGVHVTDPSNASRTLCYDIARHAWSPELCELFRVPIAALAEVRPTAQRYGVLARDVAGGVLAGTPVSALAGDQQASLFGHGCHGPGDTKVTYGTGSFVLMNLGSELPAPSEGLLTTVAWDLGDHAPAGAGFSYALEGAVFSSGATIQWLRDGLGVISAAAETAGLAASLGDNEGLYLVPAFNGLGSPWWDAHARGSAVGISRGTGRAHFARAALEAIAYQCRDVVDAMQAGAGRRPRELRADGGAAVMDLLLQFQADQCALAVHRARTTEVTARGAAMLAGLAEGVWGSLAEFDGLLASCDDFEPCASRARPDQLHAGWLAALSRSRQFSDRPLS